MSNNYLGLDGIEFVEFADTDPQHITSLFKELGMSRTKEQSTEAAAECSVNESRSLFQQNEVRFILNCQSNTVAREFCRQHGAGISSMGWRVHNAQKALATALKNGAEEAKEGDYFLDGEKVPALVGIGGSLIYLIDAHHRPNFYECLGFNPLVDSEILPDMGFLAIDHLTNNVYQGELRQWSDFYQRIFGFSEIRYFDIRGEQTGLQSFALRSPCGKFCIPINEGTEEKSQINEFLEEYRGCGVQHLALLTKDILASLRLLENTSVSMLEMYDAYYDEVFKRVPNVREDHDEIKRLNVLADGDAEGYLLQIFTKNIIGPIFFEIIQRENNHSFGEGNFGALFRAIELDQKKRGYLG